MHGGKLNRKCAEQPQRKWECSTPPTIRCATDGLSTRYRYVISAERVVRVVREPPWPETLHLLSEGQVMNEIGECKVIKYCHSVTPGVCAIYK